MRIKVFIVILLSILIVNGISVLADSNGTYVYTVLGNKATITGVEDNITFSGRQIIPERIGTYSVQEIQSYAFKDCDYLEELIIPNGMKIIGDYAFESCDNLKVIKIPQSVTSIGQSILNGCGSLEEMTIPFLPSFYVGGDDSWIPGDHAITQGYVNYLGGYFGHALIEYKDSFVMYHDINHRWHRALCNSDDEAIKRCPEGATYQRIYKAGCGGTQYYAPDMPWYKSFTASYSVYYHYIPTTLKKVILPCDYGYTSNAFLRCNAQIEDDHSFDTGVVVRQATHTTTGERIYSCVDCSATKTEVIEKIVEHTYEDWLKVDESTHKRTCECGKIETGAHAWDDGAITIEATHTAMGEKTYSCVDCSAIKTEIIEKIVEHAYGEWVKADENTHKRTCACGEIETGAHAWDDGTVTTEATHIAMGEKTYSCADCSAIKTEAIEKIAGHTFGDWVRAADNAHKRTCECGEIQFKGHVWDDGTVTIEATHTAMGEKTYTCVDCSAIKTEIIEKIVEHTYEDWLKVDESTHKRTCECGKIETGAHAWDDGMITIEATHTAMGEKTYTCADCSAIKTEIIEKIVEHAYGEWVKADESTHKRTCKCGQIQTEVHNWNTGICAMCGAHKTGGVLANGVCGVDITWQLDSDGLLMISGFGEMYDNMSITYPWSDYKDNINTVIIENGIVNIPFYAFSRCKNLIHVSIPNSVRIIRNGAFLESSNIKTINIPTGVEIIERQAFQSCTGLSEIVIPDSVTEIGNHAFYDCTKLEKITIPDTVEKIGADILLSTEYISDTNNWEDDVLYVGKHLVKAKTSLSGEYSIKNDTLTIASNAFRECSGLTSITIPESITRIPDQAFYLCKNLTNVSILGSVTYIGKFAFAQGEALKTVNIPNSVMYIDEHAFQRATALTYITLPENLTSIEPYLFEGCINLTSLSVPKSIKTIGMWAFYNTNNLKSVHYGGTDIDWNKIDIGVNNDSLANATFYFKGNDSIQTIDICVNNHNISFIATEGAYGSIIIALYGVSGEMKGIKTYDLTDKNITTIFENLGDGDYAKVFWWSDLAKLKQNCEPIMITLE